MVKQKMDLKRVVFVKRLAHHRLMAMYNLSDVVLDSYMFGGDTTTREAFEAGAPIVTLPGKHLGERWTQAYVWRGSLRCGVCRRVLVCSGMCYMPATADRICLANLLRTKYCKYRFAGAAVCVIVGAQLLQTPGHHGSHRH